MTSEEKMAFNLQAKAKMREFLQSKSWEEKVASIERMNAAGKLAREAMRTARENEQSCAEEAADSGRND